MTAPRSPKVCILIQADPLKSHRAVEALRIALGLGSHNEGHDVSIVLAGRAPHLLAEDSSPVVDGEILDKHLPVFIDWQTPFAIAVDAETPPAFHPACVRKTVTPADITSMIDAAGRVLVF